MDSLSNGDVLSNLRAKEFNWEFSEDVKKLEAKILKQSQSVMKGNIVLNGINIIVSGIGIEQRASIDLQYITRNIMEPFFLCCDTIDRYINDNSANKEFKLYLAMLMRDIVDKFLTDNKSKYRLLFLEKKTLNPYQQPIIVELTQEKAKDCSMEWQEGDEERRGRWNVFQKIDEISNFLCSTSDKDQLAQKLKQYSRLIEQSKQQQMALVNFHQNSTKLKEIEQEKEWNEFITQSQLEQENKGNMLETQQNYKEHKEMGQSQSAMFQTKANGFYDQELSVIEKKSQETSRLSDKAQSEDYIFQKALQIKPLGVLNKKQQPCATTPEVNQSDKQKATLSSISNSQYLQKRGADKVKNQEVINNETGNNKKVDKQENMTFKIRKQKKHQRTIM